MKPRRYSTLFLCILSLLTAILASNVLGGDLIYLRDGSVKGKTGQSISVIDTRLGKIFYKVKGMRSTLDEATSEVRRIEFDREQMPQNYRLGFEAFFSGEYQAAIDNFQQVKAEGDLMWPPQYAGYYTGVALQTKGEYQAAIEEYADLRKKNPTTIFLPHTYIQSSECYGALGDFASAQKILAELAEKIESLELGQRWKHEASLAGVRLVEMKGSKDQALMDQAIKDYLSLKDLVGPNFPLIQAKCLIGAAGCLQKRNQLDDAIKLYKEAVNKTDEDEYVLLSEAFNGLGDCYFKKKDEKSYKEALLSYLRVVVINENNLFTVPAEEAAKALFYSGWCFDLLRGPESKKKAMECFRKCHQLFRLTKWGKDAGERVK